MTKNENTTDRIVRVILGAALVAASFAALDVSSGKPLGIVAAVVGVVLLATAAIGFCPLYRLFGLSTCKTGK